MFNYLPDDLLGEILIYVSPAKDLIYIPFGDGEQTILLWINEKWLWFRKGF